MLCILYIHCMYILKYNYMTVSLNLNMILHQSQTEYFLQCVFSLYLNLIHYMYEEQYYMYEEQFKSND